MIRFSLTIFAASLLLPSCGEDPALVQKRRKQEIEITRLRAELALMEERLKSLPPDRTEDLVSAQAEEKRLEAKRKDLAAEVERLTAEEKSLQEQYAAYKKKYAVD